MYVDCVILKKKVIYINYFLFVIACTYHNRPRIGVDLLYVPNNRGLPAAFVEVSALCIKNIFFKSIKFFCNIVLIR